MVPDSRHRPQVLAVDDEPTNLVLIAGVLRGSCDIVVARDGAQALAQARSSPPDLVLLDVDLPDLDGYRVCKALKADPLLSDVPVIFLTGRASLDDEARGFEVGAVDYIHKPLSPAILRARVRTQLALRAALDDAKRQRKKADELLDVVMPSSIAAELRRTSTVRARRVENTAVLFSDVVGFTSWCDGRQPEEVVQTLHGMFLRLEHVARTFGVEKLKTVGDGFMGAAGLLESSEDPLLAAVRCALAMAAEVSAILPGWQLRAGIHVGPVVAGIVGGERYQFDIWGDTVNVAARLAAAAAPGKVAVLAETWLRIPAGVKGASLGMQRLKGKGEREVFEITHLL